MPDQKPSSSISRELFLRAFMTGSFQHEAVARMVDAMRDVHVATGEVFFRSGEPPDALYFIVDGEVRLALDGEEPWTFGAQSIVGAIDVMADRIRSRTATALKPSHLLQLRSEDWFDILEEYFEFTQGTVNNLASGVAEVHRSIPGDGGFLPPGPQPRMRGTGPLDLVGRMLALRSARSLSRAGVQVIASLASEADELRLQPGETLFDAGGGSRVFYFVVQGAIELTFESPPIRALFGPGELVGSVAAFGAGLIAARARAELPSVLLRLAEEDFFDEMEEHFDLARSIFAFASLERERLHLLRARPAIKPA